MCTESMVDVQDRMMARTNMPDESDAVTQYCEAVANFLRKWFWLRGYWCKRRDHHSVLPANLPRGWVFLTIGRWEFAFYFRRNAKTTERFDPSIYDSAL